MKFAEVLKRTLPFVVTVAILASLFARIDLDAALATLTLDSARVLIPVDRTRSSNRHPENRGQRICVRVDGLGRSAVGGGWLILWAVRGQWGI